MADEVAEVMFVFLSYPADDLSSTWRPPDLVWAGTTALQACEGAPPNTTTFQ
ncbi:hypothetical protein T261_8423 [Streptomyces lydicus]|nr:hypothetical protein T261_8423 [Streptomyces lydicus]